ncbi:unnamed protein product [marine sediment metagenome]|uniref:Uncharacterized protein n=1 Tax=marine sediment metagenome TaxID=412755 RepID=X0YYG8_9ZZZZ
MVISKALWNEIVAIADQPPDTFIIKTTITEPPVHTTHTEFVYMTDTVYPGLNIVEDSIVNDSIRIWDRLYIEGLLNKWERRYEPVIRTIETEIKVPVPQIVEKPVYLPARGLYFGPVIGGNNNAFLFGGSLDYVTSRDNIYKLQFVRVGGDNFYMLGMGTKLSFRNNTK